MWKIITLTRIQPRFLLLLFSEEDESGEEEEEEDEDESSEEPVKMEVDKKDKQKKTAETTPKASVRIGFK